MFTVGRLVVAFSGWLMRNGHRLQTQCYRGRVERRLQELFLPDDTELPF